MQESLRIFSLFAWLRRARNKREDHIINKEISLTLFSYFHYFSVHIMHSRSAENLMVRVHICMVLFKNHLRMRIKCSTKNRSTHHMINENCKLIHFYHHLISKQIQCVPYQREITWSLNIPNSFCSIIMVVFCSEYAKLKVRVAMKRTNKFS